MAQASYGTITIIDTNDIERIYPVYCKGGESDAPTLDNLNNWKEDVSQAGGLGNYIWQRIVTKKSGIAVTRNDYSDAVRLTGDTGSSAVPLTILQTQYAQTETENGTPNYSNSMPSPINEGWWLWVKITYSDNNFVVTKIKQGKEGEDAPYIKIIPDTLVIATTSSGEKIPSSPFEIIGTAYNTEISKWYYSIDDGEFKESIVKDKVLTYAISTSKTNQPGGNFIENLNNLLIAENIGKYLWTKVTINMGINIQPVIYYLVNYIRGNENNIYITPDESIITYQKVNENASYDQEGTWTTEEPLPEEGKRIWMRSIDTYENEEIINYSLDLTVVEGISRGTGARINIITIDPVKASFRKLTLKATNTEENVSDVITIVQTADGKFLESREYQYLLTDGDINENEINLKHNIIKPNFNFITQTNLYTYTYSLNNLYQVPFEEFIINLKNIDNENYWTLVEINVNNSNNSLLQLSLENCEVQNAYIDLLTKELIVNTGIKDENNNEIEKKYKFDYTIDYAGLTEIQVKIYSVNVLTIFTKLESKPSDWETDWTNYYLKEGNNYIQLTDDSAPIFNSDIHYTAKIDISFKYWNTENSNWISEGEAGNLSNLLPSKYNPYLFQKIEDIYSDGSILTYGPNIYKIYEGIDSPKQNEDDVNSGIDSNGTYHDVSNGETVNGNLIPLIDFDNLDETGFGFYRDNENAGFEYRGKSVANFGTEALTFYGLTQNEENDRLYNIPGLTITNNSITFYDMSNANYDQTTDSYSVKEQLILGNGARIISGNYTEVDGEVTTGIFIDLEQGIMNTPGVTISSTGLKTTNINATGGLIGGFTITDTSLKANNDTFILNTDTDVSLKITDNFFVKRDGTLYAKGATLENLIITTSGTSQSFEEMTNAFQSSLDATIGNTEILKEDIASLTSQAEQQATEITAIQDTIAFIEMGKDPEDNNHPYIQLSTRVISENNPDASNIISALRLRDDYISFVIQDKQADTFIEPDALRTNQIQANYVFIGERENNEINYVIEKRIDALNQEHFSILIN